MAVQYYISPEDLAASIAEKPLGPQNKEIVVIDVRGDMEFQEGHIKGAKHFPSNYWHNPNFVENVAKDTSGSKRIIFHCAQSQQRGPKCARIFREHLATRNAESAKPAEELDTEV